MAAPQNFVSVSRRPPDVEDYIDILRRYRSWIIGPTFAGLVISMVVAFFTPDTYLCTAAMQIRPGSVSNQLLPAAALGQQMQQRLQQLDLEILGRDNLVKLLQDPKLNLYPKEKARFTVEDVAEEFFRKNVHIVPYGMDGSSGAQAFKILFSYPDKYVARALVVELVSEFQAKDGNLQLQVTNSTRTLFDDLVNNAREKMEGKQKQLADFTSENEGRLPENFQANTLEVQTHQASIANLNQQISNEKQRQSLLESNLNNNKAAQVVAENNLQQTISTPNQTVRTNNLTYIEQAIQSKQQDCVALENKYQPNFPDVVTCKDQLKVLEGRKSDMERNEPVAVQPGNTTRVVPNTAAQQELAKLQNDERSIRASINASNMQVASYDRAMQDQQRELKAVQDKINSSPQIVQKFNQYSGELQMAKDEYANLVSKRESAGTQQQVQEHRAGETLEMLEQPITPDKPTSPIRGVWVAIGTVLGLVLGVALAGAREIKNTSLKNLKDVRAYTNLPVLSSIPLLENALLVRRKRRLAWLAWSSALIVGAALMSGALYYHYVMVPTS
jgi:succinoglycan biosynthesis transport protein ExoP